MISRKNVADSHILDLAADGFGLRAMEGRGPRTDDGDNPPGHARRRPAGSSSDPCAVRERRYRPSGSRPDCGTFDLHVGDDSTSLLADGGSCPADFATSGALQPAGGRGDASDCLFDDAGCCLLASAAAPRRRNLEASDPVAEERQRSVLAALIAAVAPSESLQIADRLLCEFRSLDRVLTQKPEALRRTLGGRDSVAALIFAARAASVEALRSSLMGRTITPTDPKLIAYLKTSMGSLPEEVLRVLFLDGACRLITDEQLQQGSLAQLILYPRIIFKRALELDAASIVLVHNHPSGDPTPSEADISSTERLAALASNLGIELTEHIVVSRSGHALIGQRPHGRGLREMVKNHLLRDSGRSTGFPDRDLALSNARRTARRRLLRRHIVGSKRYLGEPAWDMLIDLFIQHCEEKKISTGDLCVSSPLPLSTALRLVQRMCDDGLIHKTADDTDGRRQFVELNPDLAWRLLAYFGTPTDD